MGHWYRPGYAVIEMSFFFDLNKVKKAMDHQPLPMSHVPWKHGSLGVGLQGMAWHMAHGPRSHEMPQDRSKATARCVLHLGRRLPQLGSLNIYTICDLGGGTRLLPDLPIYVWETRPPHPPTF